ncbi:MAG TPA: SBBP repeat-containing protein [Rhizomicrobium sp.]
MAITSFDSSLLVSYFNSQITNATQQSANASAMLSATAAKKAANSATANDDPPWEDFTQPAQEQRDAQVLGITNFLDTTNVPLSAGSTTDAKTEQDNQKLFSLYTAVNNLSYLAQMAQRSGMTAGQIDGFNTRFQTGLQQIESYISSTSFNNFTLQAAATSSSVTSTATLPLPAFSYTTKTLTNDANINNPLSGVSTSQSFTIAVKKGGTTTQVPIDLSQVQGPLTLNNIIIYANQQLSTDGFKTRLQKAVTDSSTTTSTDGTNTTTTKNSYGLTVSPGAGETISFSAPTTQPALYLVGSTGNPTTTATTSKGEAATAAADQQGRIIKLTGLSSSPQATFNVNANPTNGTTTAQASAVDASGNIYVLGNATGDFGSQLNQGTQDVYLTKYDSAGNVQWTQMVGAADSASGYGLAVDQNGNAYVTGGTTSDLTTTAIANGNNDSFVAKYDTNGTPVWTQQVQTLNQNQSNAITVDSSGNVFIGGQVTGVIGKGQTSAGKQDGYVAELNSKGKIVYEQQLGTAGTDQVSAMTTASDGSLYVASVQNGHAVLSKYANGDATQPAVWTQDLGDLQNGGTISSIAVSGNQVYLSGSTTNTNLNGGGTATIVAPSSGSGDAYVMGITDNGSSATANTVSYVGTSATDKGGALTVGADGTVYLSGTTSGTFAGQTRSAQNTTNAFVASIAPGGAVNWVRQYGGMDGQSTGASVAIDPSGGSVLDALGLPKGTINLNQSLDLTTATTLRPGDSFQIKIATASSTRTATITIDAGETLNSLTNKINAEFVGGGKATVNYGNGSEGLKIAVNSGVTATLIAGPDESDALGRLGIAPGVITNTTKSSSSSSSSSPPTAIAADGTQAFGLGLTNNLSLSDSASAGAVRAQLLNVLSAIRNIYQTTNAPPSTTTTKGNTSSGPAPSYLTANLASYNLALNMLTGSTSSGSSSLA